MHLTGRLLYRRLQFRRIERASVSTFVEKAPSNGHDQRNNNAEENPAVKHMVEASGEFDAAVVSDVDRAKCAQPVGDDRNDDAHRHEGNPPAPASETQVGDECAVSHHSNEEFYPRTRLGHAKIAGRGRDEDTIDMGWNSGPAEQHHAHLGGQRLQDWHRFLANWHEEKHVK